MIKYSVLLILGVLLSAATYSQGNPKINRKSFFTEPAGAEAAKKELKIAEKYYKKGRGTYDEALKHYLKVYHYNSSSPVLNYKIGVCYLWTSNKKASLKYFRKSSPEVSRFYYLGLGRAYQYNHQFDKAKEAYMKYYDSMNRLRKKDARALVEQLKKECDVSAAIVKDSLPVFIINLGPVVNSYYDDYAAILSNDGSRLYFTSKRPKKEPEKRVSRFKFKERIFHTDNNAIDTAASQVFAEEQLNGKTNTSVAGFSRTEDRIYFYKGLVQNGRLMTAVMENGKWTHARKLKRINTIAYRETSVSFDKNGTAYFISTRRGGFGGKDIWMAVHKKGQKYYKPVNLGRVINTPFDEEGVYITPDGNTLYFSSKGHDGMGGFDVYKSTRDAGGNWSKPRNIGYPVNSPADELFYRPTPDTMVAVYATIRGDSYGGLDIYKIQKDPRIPFTLQGTVRDAETGTILPAAVNVYDQNTMKVLKSTVADSLTGQYSLTFEDKGDYLVQVDDKGYKSASGTIDCPAKRNAKVTMDFNLELQRHPFTLMGTVTDADKETPVPASLIFSPASRPDSVIGRVVSNDSTGEYLITFDDKYDLIIHAEAIDYFPVDSPLNVVNTAKKVIVKNIRMKRSRIEYTLAGLVTDEKTGRPVPAMIKLYRPSQDDPFLVIPADSMSGKYKLSTEEKGPFLVEVTAKGYFYAYDVFSFPKDETVVARNFNLKKMDVGASIVLKNILFNTGEATLKPSSFATLDKLAELLLKNPEVKVEVSGHTDNVGSASFNKRLSKQRALAVKNYLVSKGVEQDRIVAVGYGFEKPVASNDTPEGRQQNRRVELKILNQNQ